MDCVGVRLVVTTHYYNLTVHNTSNTSPTQGCKKMLLDGGRADHVGSPTYLWGVVGMQEIFYVYALKSILVHSETKKTLIGIILKTIRAN